MSIKGVGCSTCFHIQEGEFEMGQEIKCDNCQSVYQIGYNELDIYKAHRLKMMEQRAKQRAKEIEYEEMSWFEKLGRKTIQLIGAAIALILLSSAVVIFKTHFSNGSSTPTYNENGTRAGTKADAQYFNQWNSSNAELVALVKQGMHDPSSFEHVETRFGDKGDTYRIMMVFRGKNAFNATVTQTVTATLDKKTRTITEFAEVK